MDATDQAAMVAKAGNIYTMTLGSAGVERLSDHAFSIARSSRAPELLVISNVHTPVGFAREPSKERRRWIGRIFLALLIAGLAYVLFTRVINPPNQVTNPTPTLSSLPGA